MAPPPKYLITRRLIRNYFSKYIPKQPLESVDAQTLLFNCWQKFGFEDIKCKEYEILLDRTQEEKMAYKQKIDDLRIRQDVMKELKRPVYPNSYKGRYKKFDYQWTIYDGLQ